MKERLLLPDGHAGAAWLLAPRPPPARRELHRHTELELNLVISGRATYLLQNRKLAMHRCTLLWLFPHQDHVLLESSDDFAMWVLVFRPALVRHACTTPATRVLRSQNPAGEFCRLLPESRTRPLDLLFREISSAATVATQRDRLNAGLSYALLQAWSAHEATVALPDRTAVHPAVERTVQALRYESTPLTLTALARHAGLSPSRLSRVFHAHVGMSLSRFRSRQRLERFLILASRPGPRKLITHALDAGFGSYPQFHRVFKREMGCTPQAYLRIS